MRLAARRGAWAGAGAFPTGACGKGRAFLAVVLVLGIGLGLGCGDGGTEPGPPPVATWIDLSHDAVTLTALGDTARLSATVRDQSGSQMQAAVAWSSGDTAIAVVNATGLVTAVANGSATITATAGAASGDAVAFVSQKPSSVAVESSGQAVTVGDTLRLTATVFDSRGSVIEGATVEWASSDASVAVVSPSGLVRGLAEGPAVIMARAEEVEAASAITVSPSPDRAVLVALYEATDGPNWMDNAHWLTEAPLSQWYGVDTNRWGRVVGIHLAGVWSLDHVLVRHGLKGELPSGLDQLSHLQYLNLFGNELRGGIPSQLGRLHNLIRLDLSYNRFTGAIPSDIGLLPDLHFLDLAYNQLAGEIPPELGRLADLQYLDLYQNQLTGKVPSELGQLSELQGIYLWHNRLTGEIPPELGHLAKLQGLDLSYNQLTGTIPSELGQLADLEHLDLYQNRLTGGIPPELGQLSNLDTLFLNHNRLTGEVPTSYLALPLFRFRFEANYGLCAPGTGEFADWLGRIVDIIGPYCNEGDREALTALFKAWDGDNWTASDLWLVSNALERWHGVETDSSGRVVTLDLRRNGLSGVMASDLGRLHRLTTLRLDDNELGGRLPLALTALSLTELSYTGTGICVPVDRAFRQWLSSITTHKGTEIDCEPRSDTGVLETRRKRLSHPPPPPPPEVPPTRLPHGPARCECCRSRRGATSRHRSRCGTRTPCRPR